MAEGIDFGKQIGPLPLGAWVVVVGGGLAIAYWNSQQQNSEPVIVEDTSGDEGVGEGPGWVAVPTPDDPPPDSDIVYETNEQWAAAAITWLIGQGYPPGLSNSAINKALAGGTDIDGNKMSIQEWSLWTLALAHLGPPPYPVSVSPPKSTPDPVEPPEEPPPDDPPPPKDNDNRVPPHHVVIADRGDTISGIAARYGKGWREVWNFNLKYRSKATQAIMRSRGPNLIFKGTRIWVPK